MTRGAHQHKHKPFVNGLNDPWIRPGLADDKGTVEPTAGLVDGQEVIHPGILNRVQLCACIICHRPLNNPR